MHKYNTKITRAFLQGVCIALMSVVLQGADVRAIIVGFAALGLAYMLGQMDRASEEARRNDDVGDKRTRGSYPRGE